MGNSLVARIKDRLARTWGKKAFDKVAARVLFTPPLEMSGHSPVFLSMVCHRDVAAYLLAIKSLYLGVGQGRVAIVNDGSLTPNDLAILRHHIPTLIVEEIDAIDTGRCPRGGTWERLTRIIELTADSYVIQMDADTLVTGAIPEVVQCVRDNLSFLLGTDVGQAVEPAPVLARLAQGWIKQFGQTRLTVGMLAEAALDGLPQAEQRNYVHASSGFAGFAQGAFRLADLEDFSDLMRTRLGERWDEWGSEQIGSNYILSNAPGTVVLPLSRYACFEPHLPPGERPFLHFIGSYRFTRGLYRRQALAVLARLGH